ncbi:EpsG family protein [Muribaculaceae bacterium Isolate-104 (HZI)]|nr:EpsG family protein [Muribaculaceae bacterium Isolate-104 (HZI)]
MIYILYLFGSTLYLSTLSHYKQSGYLKLIGYSIPLILFWCLIIGCQYGVGTDYFSYIDIFKGNNFDYISGIRGEYVFSAIAELVIKAGLNPQWGFIFISLIEVLLLLYVMHFSVKNKYIYLFFFVFVCFSGSFHNQMNGLRQYLAIYMLSVVVCLLCRQKFFMAFFLSVITFFIHKSSGIVLPVILVIYALKSKDSRKVLLTVLLVGVALSMLLNNHIIGMIVPYFEMYSNYLKTGAMDDYGIVQKITKYIYIPIYLSAIYKYPSFKLSEEQRRLFLFGVYGFAIKLSVMSIATVSRIGLYLEIISCIPLVYLMIYLYNKGRTKQYLIMLLYLLAPYALKVLVMKTGEYGFDSIFFHWNQLQ